MNLKRCYPSTCIDALLWKAFRACIGKRKGAKKGVIQESLEEAIQLWIENGK